MVKSLVNKVTEKSKSTRKRVRRAKLILGMLGFMVAGGCKECDPFPNYTPETSLSATPVSGYAPLEVRIQLDGEDADGKEDISEYRVSIDEGKDGTIEEVISQSTPIDVTRTFANPKTVGIHGECIDSRNASDAKSLNVKVLKRPDIPENHPPEMVLTPITSMDEKTIQKCKITATDADGDELAGYLTAPSWVSASKVGDGYELTFTSPEVEEDTNFDMAFQLSDGKESVFKSWTTKVKNIPAPDYLDISGKLRNCKTGEGEKGLVWAYDAGDSRVMAGDFGGVEPLEEIATDSDGDFSASSGKLVSELSSGVVLRARKTDSVWENGTSYILKESFPQGDVNASTLWVVPHPQFSTPAEFKTFMSQINFFSADGIAGLTRVDLSQLQGIEILLKNTDPSKNWDTPENPNGWYNSSDPVSLRENLLAKEIGKYVCGETDSVNKALIVYVNGQQKIIPIQIESSPYSYEHYDSSGNPNLGWAVIAPDKTLSGGKTELGYLNDNKLTGLINRGKISLSTAEGSTPIHEIGHLFIGSNSDYSGHCSIPPFYNGIPPAVNTLSMMVPNNLPSEIGPADIEASSVFYREGYSPRKDLGEIFGE